MKLHAKPKILALSGGISPTSYNKKILQHLNLEFSLECDMITYDHLDKFPFFSSGSTDEELPNIVYGFLKEVEAADGKVSDDITKLALKNLMEVFLKSLTT